MTKRPAPERERHELALEVLDLLMGRLDAFTDAEAMLLIRFTDNTLAVILSRLSGGGSHEPQRLELGGPSPPLQLAA